MNVPSRRFLIQQSVLNAACEQWGDPWRTYLQFATRNGEMVPPWFYKLIQRSFRELRRVYQ